MSEKKMKSSRAKPEVVAKQLQRSIMNVKTLKRMGFDAGVDVEKK